RPVGCICLIGCVSCWLWSLISGLTARRAAPRLLRLSLTVLRRLALLRRRRVPRALRARRAPRVIRVVLALPVPMALRALRATRAILAPLVALARTATRATPARRGPTASGPRRSGTTWLPASRRSKRPRPDNERGRHG